MAELSAFAKRCCLGAIGAWLTVASTAVAVEVTVQATATGFLALEVVNRGESPVSLGVDQLPWASPVRSLQVVIVAADPRAEPLQKVVHWDEPVESPLIVLAPGETRAGEVDLAAWFKGFRQAHKKQDLIVFWTWQPQLESSSTPSRRGGWLLLPKALE